MTTEIRARLEENTDKGTLLMVLTPVQNFLDSIGHYSKDGIYFKGELRLNDGRRISADQRKKAHATIADIANWQGECPVYAKMMFKAWFAAYNDIDLGKFSLSDCSVTTARLFISFLRGYRPAICCGATKLFILKQMSTMTRRIPLQ
jgi:hypothetical protein